MSTLQTVVDDILHARSSIPSHRSILTAITGIDGCDKGYVTARIVDALQTKDLPAVVINVDAWMDIEAVRILTELANQTTAAH